MPKDDFEHYYTNIYGNRWEQLRNALQEAPASVAYSQSLREAYYLDKGSIYAAQAVRFPSEGCILDACAAPGGKSLVLSSRLNEKTSLLANELSSERRRRLVDVLNRHLNPEQRERVTVSGFDAAALAGRTSERERFSAILLDAPCSSERHVLASEKALREWTPARPRSLARRQWALLSAAFLLLAPGASLVYATCALSPEENDQVAGRLIKKYGSRVEVDIPDFPAGTQSSFGRFICPDTDAGMGPMYVARFIKCS